MVQWDWTPREKIMAGAVLILLLVAVAAWVFQPSAENLPTEGLEPYQSEVAKAEKVEPAEKKQKNDVIVIDLKGAVSHPGLYHLESGARVYDVLEKAGGAGKDADLNQVNLAQPLSDGMVVYIPRRGEAVPEGWIASGQGNMQGTSSSDKIHINQATLEELEKLDGIGPSKAKNIFQYRQEHGPFRTIEEIANVPGIGEKTLEKFRAQIVL
ncbi:MULTISPECIES: helix-hairpin-helix domain-containing protein [unclassified Thermoactinomyces]|uniref:helix-hairpin-helix domain-containing protein n=1 Tax=unclassified Thermoactinomyces TaxID=2634588 RepID=UPI0018DBA87F|nr:MULTISPECIES: helix-hairpin-helix domain-containing protein [unclassified Thermoactinomyces]MBH8597346.1 helix-hairpin-helix domain-containing protein [Thermoactinomyces sp. CICC 10523]MBH8602907.1 helix-hairpin-helix domain-containing protein [Thermoactinomyces sp. CICC 10522]MBH8607245.1 helix-hairpin-helix domain-containing protein [Thermoactinomyces sp. CICC 10521]